MTLKQSFKYRNVWMGLAMLWVIWFHLPIDVSNEFIRSIKNIGYGGVDIFLFASGLGCYHSLDKEEDCLIFLKKRGQRLLPTYWIFIIFWIIYRKVFVFIPWKAILGNLFCVADFAEVGLSFNWYLSAIWLMYFLAPVFKKLAEETNNIRKCIGIVSILVLMSICFWENANLIIVSRVSIFFVGMLFAKTAKKEVVVDKKFFALMAAMTITGVVILRLFIKYRYDDLWNKGYWWYPFILIAPGACILISCLMNLLKNSNIGKAIQKALGWIGEYSFELFLIHIWFFEIHNMLIAKAMVPDKDVYWVITCLLIIPGCLVLDYAKKLFGLIVKRVSK